jgi:hypothetical protein
MKTRAFAIAFAAAYTPAFACDPMFGSPTVARMIEDASSGVVAIYRGAGPTVGPGRVTAWTFYDAHSPQNGVTPLLFADHGTHLELVGVGTTRISNASGVQSHEFGLIAGTDTLSTGQGYAVGFTTRSFEGGPGPDDLTQTGQHPGTIDFDGYGDFSDPWDYALPVDLAVNQVYGSGGVPLNGFGFDGRIYSAEFTIRCDDTCPADLAPPLGLLDLADIVAFVLAFTSQAPSVDYDGNSLWDLADILTFVTAFQDGCP